MFAIVVIGYNRPIPLKGLLDSICEAVYAEQFDLIISLDKSDIQDKMVRIAEECEWNKGKKKIIIHEKRLGLKKHVISCGDLSKDYDAIVMFEDDLLVSKYFPSYVLEAVNKYKSNENIAGISLYLHQMNVEVGRPFEPEKNASDVFALKFPQSWGQCWTNKMWSDFRNWLSKIDDNVFNDENIPYNVKKWGNQSWLKYQVVYCIKMNKYYIYPYMSLTTNCSEKGTHASRAQDPGFQVQLLGYDLKYNMADFNELVKYDAFFEREEMYLPYIEKNKKICINLYGYKSNYNDYDYMFTSKSLNYKIKKEIQLVYRPHERNLIQPRIGKGIYLYDMSKKEKNKNKNRLNKIIDYDIRSYNIVDLMKYSIKNYINFFISILKQKTRIKGGKV